MLSVKKSSAGVAFPALVVLLVGATASAANAVPANPKYAAVKAKLNSVDAAKFDKLTAAQKAEVVAVFGNAAGMDGMTIAQYEAKFPGVTITEARTVVQSQVIRVPRPSGNSPNSAAYTVYSVHQQFRHTQTFLFISNTAYLDYYYYTGNNVVLSDNYCTWRDAGFSLKQISNISVNHWVSGGLGHCYADVQITSVPYGVTQGYVQQQMDVNGPGIYRTYFHENG